MSPRGWCISSCSFLVDFPAFVGLSAGPGRKKSAKHEKQRLKQIVQNKIIHAKKIINKIHYTPLMDVYKTRQPHFDRLDFLGFLAGARRLICRTRS